MITLRDISVRDSVNLVRWRNENAEWFPAAPRLTAKVHSDWYLNTYMYDPTQNLFVIRVDGDPIGTIGMTITNGKGQLERVILGDKSYARTGAMSNAARVLMSLYGLDTYWLRVMPDNEVAMSFYERLGFMFAGKSGEYTNVHGNTGYFAVMEKRT